MMSTPPRQSVIILLLVTALIIIAMVRVATTYPVFSATWDEGMHLASGLELLDRGEYNHEHHPPFARVVIAALPYSDGARSQGHTALIREGRAVLYDNGDYSRTLTLARIGALVFLPVVLGATAVWAMLLNGAAAALVSVILLSTLPPLLGNAGLAALDVAPVGFMVLTFLILTKWLSRSSKKIAILFGVFAALAIMSKYSAIPFIGLGCFAILATKWAVDRQRPGPTSVLTKTGLTNAAISIAAAIVVMWLSFGVGGLQPLAETTDGLYTRIDNIVGEDGRGHDIAYAIAEAPIYPTFVVKIAKGIWQVIQHNSRGHNSFLLGEYGSQGWRHYYLVGLAVKTPIPLLILGLIGLVALCREGWRVGDWRLMAPGAIFLAILLFVSLFSRINLGVRHILILYPLMAIGAGYLVMRMIAWRYYFQIGAIGAIGLVAWQTVDSGRAHPDYLADFNLLAGPNPENVLLNGDLDWGQDLRRLELEVAARGIKQIAIAYNGNADLTRHALPSYQELLRGRPVTGWVAISLWTKGLPGGGYKWLDKHQPVARVGTSIDLYFVESEN